MTEKLAEYETILKDISARVSREDADMIRRSLEKASRLRMQGSAPTVY